MTPAAIRAAQAENNADPILVLLTFRLAPAGEDVRLVNNTVDVLSRGQTFIGCPFAIVLPESSERVVTEARLLVDNVDPRIWRGVRALTFAPEVVVEVVLASEPDALLYASEGLLLREATATRSSIQGKLVPDNVWTAGFPAHEFDPAQNPGMFRAGRSLLGRLGAAA